MYWGRFAPYVSVAEKKKNAEKAAVRLVKNGQQIAPVYIEGKRPGVPRTN